MESLHRTDIVARVHFLDSSQGGKKLSIIGEYFSCPLEFGGEYYDCRLYLENIKIINPGDHVVVPIAFLFPTIVMPKLTAGMEFTLWEAKTIAYGTIIEVKSLLSKIG